MGLRDRITNAIHPIASKDPATSFAAEARQSRRNATRHERKGNTEAAARQRRLADWAQQQADNS